MTTFKFGDILRYHDREKIGDEVLFLYLCDYKDPSYPLPFRKLMVLRTFAADDQWEPGHLVLAGNDEVVRYRP